MKDKDWVMPAHPSTLEYQNVKLLHTCEVCGKTELLTLEEAFNLGWDSARMWGFKTIAPRTCPECGIEETLYFRLMSGVYSSLEELSEQDENTLKRILNEPESMIVS